MATVYFMRHSETLKPKNIKNDDTLQLQNEKWVLTVNGDNIAKKKSQLEELQNFNYVYSSNYVRAISTAKYFTDNEVRIDERFGERKFGVNNWSELPSDFGEKQFKDFDYKLEKGESINEVILREEKALTEILKTHREEKVLIVGHSTALASLFSKWCEIKYTGPYKYNGVEFFDGKWNYCETFKLEFDDNNNLVNIENIK